MARRGATTKSLPKVIAFAGPGDSTIDNTTDLLNDFLGFKDGEVPEDDDTLIYFPATKDHLSKGLESVIDWTDNLELAYNAVTNGESSKAIDSVLKYAEEISEVKNVNQALIEALRDTEDHDPYLILLYGEDGDENAEILLDLASTYGIKVLDLTAGLDDLAFEEEEATPEPEPEPEKKPEEAPRRRGRTREIEPDEKPLAEEPEDKGSPPWPVDEKKPAPARRSRAKKAEEIGPTPEEEPTLQEQIAESKAKEDDSAAQRIVATPPGVVSAEDALQAIETVEFFLSAWTEKNIEAQQGYARALETRFWLEKMLGRFADLIDGSTDAPQETADEPKRGRGRPRNDGEPTRPRTAAEKAVKEIWDEEDQQWVRAGRGRIPAGVKTRLVDPKTGAPVED